MDLLYKTLLEIMFGLQKTIMDIWVYTPLIILYTQLDKINTIINAKQSTPALRGHHPRRCIHR